MTERGWRSEGMPATGLERQEGHEGWYDMQDDDGEADTATRLEQMERQMEQMQRDAEQLQHHEHGIGY
jgi:hypothetical protein